MLELILIPTPLEQRIVENALRRRRSTVVARCGFGPIAAAARTSQLISRHNPGRVILLGVAGALDESLPLGSALRFHHVGCEGIGVGQGAAHQTAQQLGWPQWQGEDGVSVEDRIALDAFLPGAPPSGELLLTVAAASVDADEAALRLNRYPNASAEDMEGFGVAFACRLADVPCEIVRGISNRCGDRDHQHWKIRDSLLAAAELLTRND